MDKRKNTQKVENVEKVEKQEEEDEEENENEQNEEEEEQEREADKENESEIDDDDEQYDDDDDHDDEMEEDYDNKDYEADDENEETLKELLFKQLLHLRNKKKKQESTNKKTNFVTSLKKFINLNIEERAKQMTDKHVFDFMRLSKAIINKKIKMNISESDLDVLKELVEPETHADERKIVLIEDLRLKVVFKKALGILENHLNHESKRRYRPEKISNAGRKQFSQTFGNDDEKSRRQRYTSKRN